MSSTPRLQLVRLTRRLPSGDRVLTLLDSVDLTVEAGEMVAILGPSGSGKSTLLALAAGLDRPSDGDVLIDGAPLSSLNEDGLARLRRDHIGFVFQSFRLLGHLTALENTALPLELQGNREARNRARDLLARVGLEDRVHHLPVQLSGGEQQRVALARAFVAQPSLLLADEPTGNLDHATGERILELFRELHGAGQTATVLVTHDPDVAELADRRIHLKDGRIEV